MCESWRFFSLNSTVSPLRTRMKLPGTVPPKPGMVLLDLFAGIGNFSLPLAAAGARVHAVEGSQGMVERLRANAHNARDADAVLAVSAEQADLSNAEAVAKVLRQHPVDALVLDPPRTGAGRAVVEAVAASGASRIAYVACDPAALGRDLGHARQAGLEVERVVGFDAFGTTHHLVAIATLRRARG